MPCGGRHQIEEFYLRAYDTVSAAKVLIDPYVSFYNGRRPHAALDRQTPDAAYFSRSAHRGGLKPQIIT